MGSSGRPCHRQGGGPHRTFRHEYRVARRAVLPSRALALPDPRREPRAEYWAGCASACPALSPGSPACRRRAPRRAGGRGREGSFVYTRVTSPCPYMIPLLIPLLPCAVAGSPMTATVTIKGRPARTLDPLQALRAAARAGNYEEAVATFRPGSPNPFTPEARQGAGCIHAYTSSAEGTAMIPRDVHREILACAADTCGTSRA